MVSTLLYAYFIILNTTVDRFLYKWNISMVHRYNCVFNYEVERLRNAIRQWIHVLEPARKVSCLSGWVIGWEFLACHEFWVWRSSQQFWSAPPLFSSSRLGFRIDSLGKKTETQLWLVDWLVQRLYKKTTMDFSIWCLKKSSHVHGRHRAADLKPARKMIPRTWYCRCFGHYPNLRIGNY